MSNAMQFLESLSNNPAVLAQSDYVDAVSNAALKPAVKKALLARDVRALNCELGGRIRMFCAVAMPEDAQPDEELQHEVDSFTVGIRTCA